MRRPCLSLVWAMVWGVAAAAYGADEMGRRVLVVYNEREQESRALAEYYARQRGVPTNQICAIRARPAETITRREFNEDVRDPILRFLARRGLLTQEPRVVDDMPRIETTRSSISYVALVYGVPLRIESDGSIVERKFADQLPVKLRRNEASVDSELALLPVQGLPIAGPIRNPYFKSTVEFTPAMSRRQFLVGRLDGPDVETVRRMIDDALVAERYGLHGRAYFDARGIREKGYIEGDEWIKAAYEMFRQEGYECTLDEQEAVFGDAYPMSEVAVYAGWYAGGMTGPFTKKDFKFRPGAIAYHIHSSSAVTVRTRVASWVGPLLGKGAAASMGSVFEPYLAMTPHLDLFFSRLLGGQSFIEAGYASDQSLSWQTTYVGDPLYRPFASSLDEQIFRLTMDKKPELEWAWLRKVNQLLLKTQTEEARKLCHAKAEELNSAVLWEKLGDMETGEASVQAFRRALERAGNSSAVLRIQAKLP